MRPRDLFAIAVGRLTIRTLKAFGRTASSFPGQVALKLNANVLSRLAEKYTVVIVTGTNGKTTSTALIAQILRQRYPNLLTNGTGANMQQGIVSAFLAHTMRLKKDRVAVLEIDEATLIHVAKQLHPKYAVVTNIFRDQMDRYGEIYSTYNKVIEGLAKSREVVVIANGDAPIFNSAEIPHRQIFFGVDASLDGDYSADINADGILCRKCNSVLRYRQITYANLGKYYCQNCGFARPALTYAVTKIDSLTLDESSFVIGNTSFKLPFAGLYNIYNALAAYSLAAEMGFSNEEITRGFEESQGVFGRQENILLGNKRVFINLIKNPAGADQVLELLDMQSDKSSVIMLLNDNPADGQDVSWIWDAKFEKLASSGNQRAFAAGGTREKEMRIRLEVAGINAKDIQSVSDITSIVDFVRNSPTEQINILATYTAMLEIRTGLASLGYIDGAMS